MQRAAGRVLQCKTLSEAWLGRMSSNLRQVLQLRRVEVDEWTEEQLVSTLHAVARWQRHSKANITEAWSRKRVSQLILTGSALAEDHLAGGRPWLQC